MASRLGAAVIMALLWLVLIVAFAASELDRASPLDLWGVFMRMNGECALLPS